MMTKEMLTFKKPTEGMLLTMNNNGVLTESIKDWERMIFLRWRSCYHYYYYPWTFLSFSRVCPSFHGCCVLYYSCLLFGRLHRERESLEWRYMSSDTYIFPLSLSLRCSHSLTQHHHIILSLRLHSFLLPRCVPFIHQSCFSILQERLRESRTVRSPCEWVSIMNPIKAGGWMREWE